MQATPHTAHTAPGICAGCISDARERLDRIAAAYRAPDRALRRAQQTGDWAAYARAEERARERAAVAAFDR